MPDAVTITHDRDDRSRGLGSQRDCLIEIRRTRVDQRNGIKECRTAVRHPGAGTGIHNVPVAYFGIEIDNLLANAERKPDRPVRATQSPQRFPVDRPVVDITVNLGAIVERMYIKLIRNRFGTRRPGRKLLGILTERIGNGASRSGKHLLLSCAQRGLGLGDKLVPGPGQHESQETDE